MVFPQLYVNTERESKGLCWLLGESALQKESPSWLCRLSRQAKTVESKGNKQDRLKQASEKQGQVVEKRGRPGFLAQKTKEENTFVLECYAVRKENPQSKMVEVGKSLYITSVSG